MANTTDPTTTAIPFGKARKEVVYDLMRGGAGTPWENRGEHGTAGGFLKTAFRSVFNPKLLFDHIRSTTVPADAETFLRICAVFWGLAVAIHKSILFFRIDSSVYEVDTNAYVITTVIETLGGAAFAYLMFRMVVVLYHKLVTTEIKQPVPTTLTFNIVAYAMGASVLAIVPIVGPLLALLGSFVSLVAAGRKRLFVSWRGAIIDTLLVFVVVIAATAALWLVGGWVLNYLLGAVNDRPAAPVFVPKP